MFKESRLLFLYAETPVHAGSGRASGATDLPIQRERVTQYPVVQASGVKGALRANYRDRNQLKDDDLPVKAIFGEAGADGSSYAGAVSVGDARLLLLAVRSLKGVFAHTTSAHALSLLHRAGELTGQRFDLPQLPALSDENTALVAPRSDLLLSGKVVLEDFSFTARESDEVRKIAEWLAQNALPQGEAFRYWRETLPKRLCILPENAFRDFCLYGTEVQTHIRIDPEKKTVAQGALWTAEYLPADSLMYAPLFFTDGRSKNNGKPAAQVAQEFAYLDGSHLQLGGDETTGQGWMAARIYGG
ncbi:MAG: type III-B CRISPR module RAMP protein Cmr4 [Chloroflexota bacterium]|nr:MAG: type III-B CRISPR module RAMP protein Cmr4 [Bellilinea sp.]